MEHFNTNHKVDRGHLVVETINDIVFLRTKTILRKTYSDSRLYCRILK